MGGVSSFGNLVLTPFDIRADVRLGDTQRVVGKSAHFSCIMSRLGSVREERRAIKTAPVVRAQTRSSSPSISSLIAKDTFAVPHGGGAASSL